MTRRKPLDGDDHISQIHRRIMQALEELNQRTPELRTDEVVAGLLSALGNFLANVEEARCRRCLGQQALRTLPAVIEEAEEIAAAAAERGVLQ